MLMNINCSVVSSVKVEMLFDDRTTKTRVIGTGDLIDVVYNANGLRKHMEGKVLKVVVNGTDPNGWYIIVDGSDDFASTKAKFSPMSILDVDVIRKADTITFVQTITGEGGIPYIRINKNRLQWSEDGFNWKSINIDKRDIIEDQEGTVAEDPKGDVPVDDSDDGIESAVY